MSRQFLRWTWAFDGGSTTESAHGAFEIQHDYKEGTDVTPHVHWYPTTTGTGNVVWQGEYYITEDGNYLTGTVACTTAATGTAWEEVRADFEPLSGDSLGIGYQVHVRLFRDPTHAADTYTGDAALGTFGMHYEVDAMGSRTITAK